MSAEIIAVSMAIDIQLCPELAERDFGQLTGMTWVEIEEQKKVELRSKDRKLKHDYRAFGGESSQQVRRRVHRFVRNITPTDREGDLLFVTHDGVIRMLLDIWHAPQPDKLHCGSLHLLDTTNDSPEKFQVAQ